MKIIYHWIYECRVVKKQPTKLQACGGSKKSTYFTVHLNVESGGKYYFLNIAIVDDHRLPILGLDNYIKLGFINKVINSIHVIKISFIIYYGTIFFFFGLGCLLSLSEFK